MSELSPGVEIKGDTLRITNPRAVRVLAHPERQRLIWALYDGETFTATAAAQRFGLTPSAMSYHLRQLEKWGLVTRLESADGRERPWAARTKNLSVSPEAVGGAGAERAQTYYDSYATMVQESMSNAALEPGSAHLSQTRLELTDAEMRNLTDELMAVIRRYDNPTSTTGDRRTFDALLALVARSEE